jgi:hypothetical protein
MQWIPDHFSPLMFLTFLLTLTAVVAIVEAAMVAVRRKRFARLARQWEMHYHAYDVLGLAPRLAGSMPRPGAADVCVRDLLFSRVGETLLYILTVEYTVGLIHSKRRRFQAAASRDPVQSNPASPLILTFAPEEMPLLEQYEYLRVLENRIVAPDA